MRAKEFITEAVKKGILSKRKRYSTRGLHKFQDIDGRDRTYELNRVMMAAATASGEGPNEVVELDSESWVGTFNTAMPYTEEEANMLKAAYKAVGSKWEDMNRGDLESVELPSTNAESPIKPFKGYKR
jgi:hypothetical protein